MLIGLDFDNTIVCYDHAILRLAEELLELPESIPRTKRCVRDYLRNADREDEWTAFQGELYGPGMKYAKPFPFAIKSMKSLAAHGYRLSIISHRSMRPYAGPSYDLHAFANQWIKMWLHPEGLFLDDQFSFHETFTDKILAISRARCSAFLDDLPEVFEHTAFPKETVALHFSPGGFVRNLGGAKIVKTWNDLFPIINQLR